MIRHLMLALVIAALVGFAPAARADGPNSATFQDQGDHGVLTLNAAPGTHFMVRAEQADGSYATVCAGFVGFVPAVLALAQPGPVGNGQPQYTIFFTWQGGQETLAIEDPNERWYLE